MANNQPTTNPNKPEQSKRSIFPAEERNRTVVVTSEISEEDRKHIHLTWKEMVRRPNNLDVTFIVVATPEKAQEIHEYLKSKGVECTLMSNTTPQSIAYFFEQVAPPTPADIAIYIPPYAIKSHMIEWRGGYLLFIDFLSWEHLYDAITRTDPRLTAQVRLSHESEHEAFENSVAVLHYQKNSPDQVERNRALITKRVAGITKTNRFIIESFFNIGCSAVYFERVEHRAAFLESEAWWDGGDSFKIEARKPKLPTPPKQTRNTAEIQPVYTGPQSAATSFNVGLGLGTGQVPNNGSAAPRPKPNFSYLSALQGFSRSEQNVPPQVSASLNEIRTLVKTELENTKIEVEKIVQEQLWIFAKDVCQVLVSIRSQMEEEHKKISSDLLEIKSTMREMREEITKILEDNIVVPSSQPDNSANNEKTQRAIIKLQGEVNAQLSEWHQKIAQSVREEMRVTGSKLLHRFIGTSPESTDAAHPQSGNTAPPNTDEFKVFEVNSEDEAEGNGSNHKTGAEHEEGSESDITSTSTQPRVTRSKTKEILPPPKPTLKKSAPTAPPLQKNPKG